MKCEAETGRSYPVILDATDQNSAWFGFSMIIGRAANSDLFHSQASPFIPPWIMAPRSISELAPCSSLSRSQASGWESPAREALPLVLLAVDNHLGASGQVPSGFPGQVCLLLAGR
jgi:hypothetical protein